MADVNTFRLPGGGRYAIISWREVEVKIAIRPGHPFDSCRIYGCPTFQDLFKTEQLKIVPSIGDSIDKIIEEIADAVAVQINKKRHNLMASNRPSTVSAGILKDLQAIGWENIIEVDSSTTKEFRFRLDESFQLICKSINEMYTCELNPGLPYCHFEPCDTLSASYFKAKQKLESFGSLFAFLDDLDAALNTSLLLGKWHTARDILLEPGRWVHIEFDPENIKEKPVCSHEIVWDSALSPLENIKCNFPSKSDGATTALECGICSSTKDSAGTWVDFTCTNLGCGQIYHQSCLLEWFLADPRTIKSFGQAHGSCPFCDETNILDF